MIALIKKVDSVCPKDSDIYFHRFCMAPMPILLEREHS